MLCYYWLEVRTRVPSLDLLFHCVPSMNSQQLLFVIRKEDTQTCRAILTKFGLFDASKRIVTIPGEPQNGIPITADSVSADNLKQFNFSFEIRQLSTLSPLKHKPVSPYERLLATLTECVCKENLDLSILKEVPNKWERLGDLVLLPHSSFKSGAWSRCPGLWEGVCAALLCGRLARNAPISNDDYRQSQAVLLWGDTSWVEHTENGIVYCYDVTKCMFSSGNISQKLRMSHLDCSDEIVVDLFAGIGYFTLTYLVHCGAKLVHACEWNPNALQALEASLTENGVRDRCVIHAGDNRLVAPVGVADRVNLGLLPSSEGSWETACRCLKPTGGTVVVHGNVNSLRVEPRLLHLATAVKDSYPAKEVWQLWSRMVQTNFQNLLDCLEQLGSWEVAVARLEHVKSYAPRIDHLVVELACRHS